MSQGLSGTPRVMGRSVVVSIPLRFNRRKEKKEKKDRREIILFLSQLGTVLYFLFTPMTSTLLGRFYNRSSVVSLYPGVLYYTLPVFRSSWPRTSPWLRYVSYLLVFHPFGFSQNYTVPVLVRPWVLVSYPTFDLYCLYLRSLLYSSPSLSLDPLVSLSSLPVRGTSTSGVRRQGYVVHSSIMFYYVVHPSIMFCSSPLTYLYRF